jgi:hypothetical protein
VDDSLAHLKLEENILSHFKPERLVTILPSAQQRTTEVFREFQDVQTLMVSMEPELKKIGETCANLIAAVALQSESTNFRAFVENINRFVGELTIYLERYMQNSLKFISISRTVLVDLDIIKEAIQIAETEMQRERTDIETFKLNLSTWFSN